MPNVEPAREEEPIEDPFERDTIRFQSADSILGVTLGGPKVGTHSTDVFTFGEFLAQLDRSPRIDRRPRGHHA